MWNATGNPVEIIDVVAGGGRETIAATLRAGPDTVWATAESPNGLYAVRGQLFVASPNHRAELTLPPGQNCMLYFDPTLQGLQCAYR